MDRTTSVLAIGMRIFSVGNTLGPAQRGYWGPDEVVRRQQKEWRQNRRLPVIIPLISTTVVQTSQNPEECERNLTYVRLVYWINDSDWFEHEGDAANFNNFLKDYANYKGIMPERKRMTEDESRTIDQIVYSLATRQIAEAGVREDGDDYVIEVGGRLTIARFPLAGRTKRDIRQALFEGVENYLAEHRERS